MNLIKIIIISIAAATLIIIAIIHENSATPETSLVHILLLIISCFMI